MNDQRTEQRQYNCDICTAQCNFEAMYMCQRPIESCPVIVKLATGEIVDRRLSDNDPNFPSEFTYA